MSDVPVRLLRETLREDAAAAPASACLDADTLAAASDRTLSAGDRAAMESHAAGCARCQAMLAVMAITAPPAPARKWWRTETAKWLAPLAAAAAAATVWVAVPRTPVEPNSAVAHAPATAPAVSSSSEPPAADAANSQRAIARVEAPAPPAVQPQTRRDARGAVSAPVAAAPPAQRAQVQGAAPNALRDPAASQSSSLSFSAPTRVDAFASSAVPPAPPAATPAPTAQAASSAVAPPARLEEAVGVTPNATESVQLRRERASGAAPAQALAKTSAVVPDIVSPDRNVRWRIRTPGSVDRSIDGGLTWQAQATGVGTPLVSGAAPSPTVCWVVGSGGTVLRSTDGATWQRVGLSEAIDLTAIRAADAMNATVTAADGRMFTTADGGTTWRPM